jgi:hypothetical protein
MLQAQTRHGSGEPNAPPIGAGYRQAADYLEGSSETTSETHQALSDGPAWANMSCSRSRTDDGAAMPSAYQIKLSGAYAASRIAGTPEACRSR